DLPFLSLFSRLLPEVGSGGRTYEETLAKIHGTTGGINASLSLHISHENPNLCTPSFGLKGRCLKRNRHELFQLLGDLIATPNFEDKERIQELISQHITSLQHRLNKKGLSYASQLVFASTSLPSFLLEKWHGLSYYQVISQNAKEIDFLIEKLKSLQKQILTAATYDLVISSDHEQWEDLQKDQSLSLLKNKLPSTATSRPWQGNYFLPKISSQARSIATPVAFQALGLKTASYRDPEAPYLLLATELLQNCYLHTEIREKGGAYGGGANFSPSTGNFYLYSYRDPHLVKTWKTFQKGLDRIAEGRFTEEQLEEAKLCCLQTLDAPVIPGNRAILAYGWQRCGRTKQRRAQFREALLSAKKEDIMKALEPVASNQEKIFISFLGEKLYQKEKEKLP
ncbi:MAG: insulinase family protein, partial [Chlamydiia bacterium]|nr:insulinase family protein [Chlamydiia bacterium]